ncbi:MAG: uroporphyrinogen-III synthase [Paracoccaceae bacterium]
MPDTAPTVLLTRPEAQSQRFAKDLRDARVVISPILKVQYLDLAVDPRKYDRLIFTSENGLRAAASATDLRGMQGYAVGERTAEVGAKLGLDLRAAKGNADDLVSLILQDRPKGKLLHLHGVNSRGEIAKRLKGAGIDTVSTIIYDQIEMPLSEEALALLGTDRTVVLPVFSPRSAALLGRICRDARARLVLIGMSQAVLDSWTGPEPVQQIALATPSASAMRQEILRHTSRAP